MSSDFSFGFGTVTSQGVGSNLNISGIVTDLMKLERIPLERIIAQKTGFDAKVSSLGTIKSSLSSFQSALAGLQSGTSILANKATSSNAAFVTATGTAGSIAGNYSIEVSQLAQSQKIVATGQADATAAIGGGTATTLTIDLGTFLVVLLMLGREPTVVRRLPQALFLLSILLLIAATIRWKVFGMRLIRPIKVLRQLSSMMVMPQTHTGWY